MLILCWFVVTLFLGVEDGSLADVEGYGWSTSGWGGVVVDDAWYSLWRLRGGMR
jgi:hypothetical protein